ncbi:MAG TPA: farnesyl diphosphate synthase [Terriglobia bacterium]|nr:farnesyl diphosphate synthase [Terriglobia bacterium]
MSATLREALQPYLDEQRSVVDAEIEHLLPPAGAYPESIHRAMRYAVFAGGKRLRPILCAEAGRLFDGDAPGLLRLASALELIHTYSLIHDDLPALDNDDLRRGKPTCHRVFGEAVAILAGNALLTLAFETLAAPSADPDAEHQRLRIIHEIAQAIGTRGGMLGGEVVDLESTAQAADSTTLDYIHAAKTGSFIRAAVRCGAMVANAAEADLTRLTQYGEKVGLAFQIADDLLDVLGSKEMLGKAVRKDGAQRKATYPGLHGVEASQRIAAGLIDEACEVLALYGSRAERLREIARFLIARTS